MLLIVYIHALYLVVHICSLYIEYVSSDYPEKKRLLVNIMIHKFIGVILR